MDRKKSVSYENSKKYLMEKINYEEKFDWKNFDFNLNVSNKASEINHVQPLLSKRNRLIRGLALKIRHIIQNEIRFTLNPIVSNQIKFNAHSVRTLNQISKFMRQIENKLKNNNEIVSEHSQNLSNHSAEISEHSQNLSNHSAEISEINKDLSNQKNHITQLDETINPNLEWNYLEFENQFRGREDDIQKNQEEYLNFIKDALKNKGEYLLDVGCGRGEFLKILSENNISAKGIDNNLEMVKINIDKERVVYLKDANSFLESLPENNLIGVTAFQVIEHFPPEYLLEFIKLSYNKIAKDGVIILESVNPMSFFSMSHFWYDISHKKPLPPDIMKFYLEKAGFKNVEIRFSGNVPDGLRLEGNDDNIKKLNQLLFGPQDYAVIGWK